MPGHGARAQVPKGRLNGPRPSPFSRPCGTDRPTVIFPALKRRAMFMMSLRDGEQSVPENCSKPEKHFCTSLVIPLIPGSGCLPSVAVSEVTRILDRVQHGDAKAAEELLPLVYDELRRLAAHKMANEAPGQTLQPTALVHEAWLRLSQQADARWQNREQFYAMAAEVMRRILVDRARRRQARKHGGDLERVELDAVELPGPGDEAVVLQVQ